MVEVSERMYHGGEVGRGGGRLAHGFDHGRLPAAGRLGLGPIDVFNTWYASDGSFKYVLLPGRSLDVLINLEAALLDDASYARLAAPFRNANTRRPPFQRLSSSILRTMPGLKQMELPAALTGSPKRVFELRLYEQPTYETHERKVRMFLEEEAAQLDAAGRVAADIKLVWIGPTPRVVVRGHPLHQYF
jgi:hypothetical protein